MSDLPNMYAKNPKMSCAKHEDLMLKGRGSHG